MTDPIAWPFEWGGEYEEQLDWLTDVLKAPTGGTQHRRLRDAPRTTLSFSTLQTGDRRRSMEALLRRNVASTISVPVPVDARPLLAAAAISDETLSLDVGIARIVVGSRVMLVAPDFSRYEFCEVAEVVGDSLTLAGGLAQAWPAGSVAVPVRNGKFASVPTVERFTSDATSLVQLHFRLDEPLESAPGFAGATYRDFPVFEFVPVWTTDPAWLPDRPLLTVDYETATPLIVDLAGVPLGKTVMQYAAIDAAEVAAFRSALFALAGRWYPAWVPTWSQDFRLAAATPAAASYLDIVGPMLAGETLFANRRDVRIAMADGSVLYRRIESATDIGGGIERLALDTAIADGLAVSDVAMISLMALCVQDADTNLLRYFNSTVLECELAWRELDHEL